MGFAFVEADTGGDGENNGSDWEEVTEPTNRVMIKTLIPTSDQLASLGLVPGENLITFTVKSRL